MNYAADALYRLLFCVSIRSAYSKKTVSINAAFLLLTEAVMKC